jgi:hypothetical protein
VAPFRKGFISELCRREGITAPMYYGWSKEFLEAGKRRLADDTARAATSGEAKDLRREATALKEAAADMTRENRLLKNVWPAPLQGCCCQAFLVCINVSGLRFILAKKGSARLGPHIVYGAEHHIFDQAAETPVRPLRCLSSDSLRLIECSRKEARSSMS